MRIGIFDSGLGGLIIAKAIFRRLPKYDYIYLGDTKQLPYGEKSPAKIYQHTARAVDFLFNQNCQIIIIACNTASAAALRKIQRKYLPKKYPHRRVLGVIIPTLEEATRMTLARLGIIGTTATINSHIYKKELTKIDKQAKIFELAAPRLVPLIEANALQQAEKSLKLYLKQLLNQRIEALILGCTHYPIIKKTCRQIAGKTVTIISQDEIIPNKLADYLKRHRELAKHLSRHGTRKFFVTLKNRNFNAVAKKLYGKKINFKLAKY